MMPHGTVVSEAEAFERRVLSYLEQPTPVETVLAAEVAELRKVLNWLVSDIREIAREQGISGAELYRNPCRGIGIHAFDTAVELLGLAQQKQEG